MGRYRGLCTISEKVLCSQAPGVPTPYRGKSESHNLAKRPLIALKLCPPTPSTLSYYLPTPHDLCLSGSLLWNILFLRNFHT